MSDGDDVLIERALKKDLAALEQLLFLRYDWLLAEAKRKIPRDLWDIIGPEDCRSGRQYQDLHQLRKVYARE